MPATIAGSHLGIDTHANRPAANAAGQPFGALYSCSTHGLIYKTDGSSWATYATLGAAASGSITASGYTQNTARLLGRNTASAGAIEEITLGTNLSFSGTTLNAAGGSGLSKSYVKVRHSTNQTLASDDTLRPALFDTDVSDADGWHDTASNTSRLTVPTGKGGIILIGYAIYTTGTGDGHIDWCVRKDGTTVLSLDRDLGTAEIPGRVGVVIDAGADAAYYELCIRCDSTGTDATIIADNPMPSFWALSLF